MDRTSFWLSRDLAYVILFGGGPGESLENPNVRNSESLGLSLARPQKGLSIICQEDGKDLNFCL
eukprot:scaffold3867_cov150-Ochromonas_danica.AAC.9